MTTRTPERAQRERRPSRFDYSKVTVGFESGGTPCEGWLYRPDRPVTPPVVVMAGGLGAERSFGTPAFAERFAERGYAALVFDYRNAGGSGGDPRGLVSPTRQVEDYRAAVAAARDTGDVDGGRLALWGAGLAGGHVVRVAAEDVRVSAVVAQTPLLDGRAFLRSRGVGFLAKALAVGVRDRAQSLAFDPYSVPIVGGPDEFAVLSGGRVRSDYLDLVSADSGWANETPARTFLSLLRYRPISDAGDVACPTLLLSGRRDDVVPEDPIERAAEDLPEGTHVRLPVGHFDAYRDRTFEQAVGYQLAFLDSTV